MSPAWKQWQGQLPIGVAVASPTRLSRLRPEVKRESAKDFVQSKSCDRQAQDLRGAKRHIEPSGIKRRRLSPESWSRPVPWRRIHKSARALAHSKTLPRRPTRGPFMVPMRVERTSRLPMNPPVALNFSNFDHLISLQVCSLPSEMCAGVILSWCGPHRHRWF